VVATVAVAAVVLSACSSSKSGSGGTKASGTIKIGVMTDSTGMASSAYQTTEKGIKAYVDAVNAAGGVNGRKLSYVISDTTSTTSGALTAAQKLVQSDKVFAVISVSALFFAAEPYLLQQNVPVVGYGFDGPEWADKKNANLFAALVNDFDKVYTTMGEYLKSRGATACAAIGYADSPSSKKAASGSLKSCEHAGLRSAYVNQISTGTTDVGPIALAIKQSGADAVYLPIDPSTGFAIAGALQQLGVKLKSLVFATGYGGDLLASSAAVKAAQGYQFGSIGQPVEMNTPATQKFVKDLAAVGVATTPTFAEQASYLAMSAFVAGLRAAGADPTQSSFMSALRGVKNFDADGLISPLKRDFSDYAPTQTCVWVVELSGQKFTPEPNTPTCGTQIPGVKP
jgi:branched-chain amino acid transport system substrate-binding protein